jgi:hypothetical protein
MKERMSQKNDDPPKDAPGFQETTKEPTKDTGVVWNNRGEKMEKEEEGNWTQEARERMESSGSDRDKWPMDPNKERRQGGIWVFNLEDVERELLWGLERVPRRGMGGYVCEKGA